MVDNDNTLTKVRKRLVSHHTTHDTSMQISQTKNEQYLPILPLVKKNHRHQIHSSLVTKPWRFKKTLLALFIFLVFALAMISYENVHLSWKTRRQLKKSMLSIRSAIPSFVRNPMLTIKTALSSPEPIHTEWHPKHRNERFPSVEARVQLYMSNWYTMPCNDDDTTTNNHAEKFTVSDKIVGDDGITTWQMTSSVITSNVSGSPNPTKQQHPGVMVNTAMYHNKMVLLDRIQVNRCAHPTKWYQSLVSATTERPPRVEIRPSYCQDVVDMIESRDHIVAADGQFSENKELPLIVIFGDVIEDAFQGNVSLPVFTKYRDATTRHNLKLVVPSDARKCLDKPRPPLLTTSMTSSPSKVSPIIWKLNSERHWAPLEQAKHKDIPWKLKKKGAVWRGVLTGTFDKKDDQRNSLEKCQNSVRCNFVFQHANSNVMDVGLTDLLDNSGIDPTIRGVSLVKGLMSFEELQHYKIIISLEGNDVSSGLKWQLLSKSVVIMSPPTLTSWAMEELLEPWVHYVPMHHNGSNAEDMVQWVLDHDEQAQRISERATLFMEDMVYHPDAAGDEKLIKENIIKRYTALWTSGKDKE